MRLGTGALVADDRPGTLGEFRAQIAGRRPRGDQASRRVDGPEAPKGVGAADSPQTMLYSR